MRRLLLSLLSLAFLSGLVSAQTITHNFGSGANAFTMDFVTIGNPGNAADTTGNPNPAGSVAYIYNIGKYEVSRGQIDKANAAGSLGITMYDMTSYGGNGVNKPATGVSWYEAAKYVNWLNTSTGWTTAYKFDGSGNFQLWSSTDAGYNANNMFRNSLAKYVIASTDEWYKAAYGNLDGTWNNYPTGSDNSPDAVASGTAANTAVYMGQSGPADINNAGGLSPYGTMAQGGNVCEWMESAYDVNNNIADWPRGVRGGQWIYFALDGLDAWRNGLNHPSDGDGPIGFRVAMVPEPSSLSLLALGGVVVALCRRKRV
jgi:formylglycine-generating enzyme required for sulfatase activity